MANIRMPIGIVATGVPMANASNCDGLVLIVSTWRLCGRVGLSSFCIVSRVRPGGQFLQSSGQDFELLVCAELV
jgi:hypothetical protein